MPTKVIAYIRVSTDQQAQSGLSLEAQAERLKAYASLYDLEIVETITDSESASSLDRPGLTRARAMLAGGKASALLVSKLDRLTRSVCDLGELIKNDFAQGKADLMVVDEHVDTSTAAGRMVASMLAVVSEWECGTIGERTLKIVAHKRERGERVGMHAPLGCKLVGNMVVPDEREREAIAIAKAMRAENASYGQIGKALAERGHKNRAGRHFEATTIRRMLKVA